MSEQRRRVEFRNTALVFDVPADVHDALRLLSDGWQLLADADSQHVRRVVEDLQDQFDQPPEVAS